MGRSARKGKLRCSKCEKRDGLDHNVARMRGECPPITWRNVEVYGKTRSGDHVKIRCRTCGHHYSSDSSAAFRALHLWEKEQVKSD